ncbi:hypothetical protein [Mucilaginibacter sp.]|uniref:hypothetical protein n=1 Tax=Mucilaginibacter sp. TaxID=1882438 RepID=UPI002617F210|nr:hypothetical protein [Mucilaginibacter sp.]MDB5032189.1 hypothetical protein [Mucilaginibacter sp.]
MKIRSLILLLSLLYSQLATSHYRIVPGKERKFLKQANMKSKFNEYIVPQYASVKKSNCIDNRFINYNNISANSYHDKDSVVVYYAEEYGSSCCPADPRIYIKPSLHDYIKQFEDAYKVKIGKSYIKKMGKEGESIIYFTLNGLTPTQKIEFADKRIHDLTLQEQLIFKEQLIRIARSPPFHFPFAIEKKGLMDYP